MLNRRSAQMPTKPTWLVSKTWRVLFFCHLWLHRKMTKRLRGRVPTRQPGMRANAGLGARLWALRQWPTQRRAVKSAQNMKVVLRGSTAAIGRKGTTAGSRIATPRLPRITLAHQLVLDLLLLLTLLPRRLGRRHHHSCTT
eukprot:COSAG02_NODE_3062_length_7447_cov_14.342678_7_plen_141_part_00